MPSPAIRVYDYGWRNLPDPPAMLAGSRHAVTLYLKNDGDAGRYAKARVQLRGASDGSQVHEAPVVWMGSFSTGVAELELEAPWTPGQYRLYGDLWISTSPGGPWELHRPEQDLTGQYGSIITVAASALAGSIDHGEWSYDEDIYDTITVAPGAVLAAYAGGRRLTWQVMTTNRGTVPTSYEVRVYLRRPGAGRFQVYYGVTPVKAPTLSEGVGAYTWTNAPNDPGNYDIEVDLLAGGNLVASRVFPGALIVPGVIVPVYSLVFATVQWLPL